MDNNQRKKIVKVGLLETFAEIIDTLYGSPMGASGTNHAPGLVPDPGATAGSSKFLCEDGTWKVPSGGGGGNSVSVMGGSGTNHASGLVPDPGATAGTSKFLREDGTWSEPTDEPEIIKGYLQSGNFYTKQGTINADYVEIGGIKWATMNIGASSITDSGLYFQWGDTKGYGASEVGDGEGLKYFGQSDYKYTTDGFITMSKYNATDNKTTLDLSDDAARVYWEGNWRIPTLLDFTTLYDAVNKTWVTDYQGSGINGTVLEDKNDSSKTLFFPASGIAQYGNVNNTTTRGFYSTKNVYLDDYYSRLEAVRFNLSDVMNYSAYIFRMNGLSIRCVWDGEGVPTIPQFSVITPSANKIYVDVYTNKTYRYVDNSYIEIGTYIEPSIINNKGQSLQIVTLNGSNTQALTLDINKYYNIYNTTGTLVITLPTMQSISNNLCGSIVRLDTSSSPSITISSANNQSIEYFEDFKIEANKKYELNFIWNNSKWSIAYGRLS